MEAASSGITRFIIHVEHGVVLELGDTGASASLAARFNIEFGADPDYGTTAVAGITFSLGEERGCCISRTPSPEATSEAIRVLAARYGSLIKPLPRPPFGTGREQGVSGLDWTVDLIRQNYDSSVVTTWPPLVSSRPVRDLIVLAIKDSLTFIHCSSRAGEPCPPAATVEDALTFASVERAKEWIERHAQAQRNDLVLMYRSVALSRMDQSDAEVNQGLRG